LKALSNKRIQTGCLSESHVAKPIVVSALNIEGLKSTGSSEKDTDINFVVTPSMTSVENGLTSFI